MTKNLILLCSEHHPSTVISEFDIVKTKDIRFCGMEPPICKLHPNATFRIIEIKEGCIFGGR